MCGWLDESEIKMVLNKLQLNIFSWNHSQHTQNKHSDGSFGPLIDYDSKLAIIVAFILSIDQSSQRKRFFNSDADRSTSNATPTEPEH